MIETIKSYIDDHQLIPTHIKTVYVAVSGGIDSCVLLDILYHLRKELVCELIILHFNHQTRGDTSNKDEKFVESLAQKYKLKIKIGKLNPVLPNPTETYLREQRYKFFAKAIRNQTDARIATGHNLNDNVETFLMRLARGSRVHGLLAIRPARIPYIRPMLEIRRREIVRYAERHKIAFREDETNLDTTILRNKIRHKVIPFLDDSFQTDVLANIPRVIDDLTRYYALYEDKLKEVIKNTTKKTKTGISLHRKRYLNYDDTVRRGLIEYCVSSVYPLNYKVSDRNLTIWDNFITEAQAGKKFTYLTDAVAIAERVHILFGEIPEDKIGTYRLMLGESICILDRYQFEYQKVEKENVSFTSEKNIEYIDGDKSGPLLTVRFWQKGDYFRPLGMHNSRKLSDFFIDLKISTSLKKDIPIVCKGDQIIWVAGHRIDDQFKVSDSTKNIYKLKLVDLHKK